MGSITREAGINVLEKGITFMESAHKVPDIEDFENNYLGFLLLRNVGDIFPPQKHFATLFYNYFCHCK